jgi:predicted permease
LRPLPFPEPGQLVQIFEAQSDGSYQDNIVDGGSYATWKDNSRSFSSLAIKKWTTYSLSGAGNQLPEVVGAENTSWNLFPLLGVQPALGRLFTAADDRPDANATAVLSWGLWKSRYSGDLKIIGQTIFIDAKPYTVIGVLPAWFSWPDGKVQLWTPLYHEKSPELMRMFAAHNFDVVGRLRPGITIQQAGSELNAFQRTIRRQHPDGAVSDAVNLRTLLDAETHGVKTGLYALLAATTCLLLIACLNIANLLVARSATRTKETAIRTALGGSRMRLVRGQIMESTILSGIGGLLGLALAKVIVAWLVVSALADTPLVYEVHMDGVVIVFALLATIGCGLLAGLIPALASRDAQVLLSLQESSRASSGGRARARLRQVLLALEVGLTVVLLTGAGLLLRSYSQLRSVDLGCTTSNILTMQLSLPKATYNSAARLVSFYDQLLNRVRALPGVQDAGITTGLPAAGRQRNDTFIITENPPLPRGQVIDALTRFVDPGYFSTMQIPLVEGRTLLPDERLDLAQSVVVNRALVRKYFPSENPIGKHILTDAVSSQSLRIVGVVGDTRDEIALAPYPVIYYPLLSGSERAVVLTVRTPGDPTAIALSVQKAIAGIDSSLPVANVLTMDQIVGRSTLDARFEATLLLLFAALSLLLAMVGVFGVLSFLVAQRTGEIGIRIALGAQREQVLRLMLFDGLQPAVYGLVLGLAASAGVARLIQSMLFGTRPFDPAVFAAVAATLLSVAALACLVPAWRASRLDPMQALRTE